MFRSREEKPEQLRHRISAATCSTYGAQRAFTLAIQPADASLLRKRYDCVYEFKVPRPQKDPILRLIRRAILELNETSEHGLLMWNNNIRAVPSTTAPAIWPPNSNGKNNDVKFYTFFQDKTEFPATFPVSIIPRVGELTADNIHVRHAASWIPIHKFLLDFADPCLLWWRGAQSSSYFWYTRSKKTFRLMDLPTELRLIILQHAIAPAGEIYPLNVGCRSFDLSQDFARQRITLGRGYEKGRLNDLLHARVQGGPGAEYMAAETLENCRGVAEPNLALLYVSKRVMEEALAAAWENTTKCFLDHWLFIPVVESQIGAAARFNHLGCIELSFTPKSWFKFFGVDVRPTVHMTESENMGHYLSRLPNKTRLRMRFRDPADGYAGDPWGHNGEWEHGAFEVTTCQTVLINWILTFAYPHIAHMLVNITGFVRKPQQDHWNAVFHQVRRNGEHEHDNGAALQDIFALQSHELPPTCICRKSCTCDHLNRQRYSSSAYFDTRSSFDFEDESRLKKRVEWFPDGQTWELQIEGFAAGDDALPATNLSW